MENEIAVNIQNWHNYRSDNTIWIVEPYNNKPVRRFPLGIDMNLGIKHLDWNSNGKKLTYSYDVYGELYIINDDGTENKVIPGIAGIAPCWSGDGD